MTRITLDLNEKETAMLLYALEEFTWEPEKQEILDRISAMIREDIEFGDDPQV